MKDRLLERVNGDLTDPLNLNIIIYTCTYALSIISALMGVVPDIGREEFLVGEFWRAFTDCIVPTTATLVLGNVIQNLVVVSEYRIKRFALSIWAVLSVLVYMMIYPLLREYELPCFTVAVAIASIGIVVLGMNSIAQIEKEKQGNSKNLSG